MKKFVVIPFHRFESEIKPLLEISSEPCNKSADTIDEATTQPESEPATSQGQPKTPEASNKEVADTEISTVDAQVTTKAVNNDHSSAPEINKLLKSRNRKRNTVSGKRSRVKKHSDNGPSPKGEEALWLEP